MRNTTISCLAIPFLLSVAPLFGQDNNGAPSAPPAAAKRFQWYAGLDGFAATNFSDLSPGVSAPTSFSSAFRLGVAAVDMDYKTEHFGAHLTGGYGDQFTTMASMDRLKGANSYLLQSYVSYRPLKDNGLQFDFGKFVSGVGAEDPASIVNFNYSRSILFGLGAPLYEFGVRASVPVTKTFSVGAQLTNGWNNVQDNNSGKTVGITTALNKRKWSWSQAVLAGPEKNGTNQGKRELVDEVLRFNPRSSLQSYVELLYGRDKRAGLNTGADSWYGVAVATRWNINKKFSLAPRFEDYVDQTGFTSGIPQHLHEATATAEYRVRPHVTMRAEYREDFSDRKVFESDGGARRKQQGTTVLALLVGFKGER